MRASRRPRSARGAARLLPVLVIAYAVNGWTQVAAHTASTPPSSPSAAIQSHLPVAADRENWAEIKLGDKRPHEIRVLLGEKDEQPEFTRELLRVEWRTGDPIDLYVILPVNVERPPVVIYLYSYPSESSQFLNNAFCKALTHDGFAAVGFVSALTGQRYHGRPMKEWFVSELQEALGKSTHDVQMTLNYLATRGDLDMNRVGMFGQGSGGTIALLAAAADDRIRAVDVLDPWGDWPDWLAQSPVVPEKERANYLKPEFLTRVAPLDPVRWMPALKSRSLRFQLAKFDKSTPEAASERIRAALPATATLVIYEDVTDYQARAVTGGRIIQWLHAQLAPTPGVKH